MYFDKKEEPWELDEEYHLVDDVELGLINDVDDDELITEEEEQEENEGNQFPLRMEICLVWSSLRIAWGHYNAGSASTTLGNHSSGILLDLWQSIARAEVPVNVRGR